MVSFLTYASNQNLRMWEETVLGFSPSLDDTLYFGLVSVALLLPALFGSSRKERIPLIVSIAVLLLFTLGGYTSFLFYSVWPLMKFFRHLSLITPLIKLFLCLLAGFGMEALLQDAARCRRVLLIATPLLAGIVLWDLYLAMHLEKAVALGRSLVFPRLLVSEEALQPVFLWIRLTESALLASIAAFLLFAIARRPGNARLALGALLALHCLDLFSYKSESLWIKTQRLTPAQYALNNFQTPPFEMRRDVDFASNVRGRAMEGFDKTSSGKDYGVVIWTIESYLFKDALSSLHRMDYWMRPLDDLMRAQWKQPLGDLTLLPKGLRDSRVLDFPNDFAACSSAAASTQEKIQLFDGVRAVASDAKIGEILTTPRFKGDVLLVSKPDARLGSVRSWSPKDMDAHERLSGTAWIAHFSANELTVMSYVDPQSVHREPWLFYSDVWHPFWNATVNGRPVPVLKANLAYKAVPIHPGLNVVRFTFDHPLFDFFSIFFEFNALFWICAILWLCWTS